MSESFLSVRLLLGVVYLMGCRTLYWEQEGGFALDILISFYIAVMAGVVCHLICKWLDDNKR